MSTATYTFAGMNNVDDPANVGARIPKIRAIVFTEGTKIVNADPDNAAGCALRPGQVLATAGSFHSGWSDPYNPIAEYIVGGTTLYRRNPDGSLTPLMSTLTPDLPVSFVQVNDVTVFSNGHEMGVIERGEVVTPWVSTEPFMVPMVPGEFLEFYNGRLYVLSGDTLYCSLPLGAPGGIEVMDERQCVVATFDGPGTMLQRVDTGLFVSAGNATWFLSGADPFLDGGFEHIHLAPYPAIRGTACPVPAEKLKLDGWIKWACMWASTRGACVGGNGGAFMLLDKFAYPASQKGAAVVRDRNGASHFLCALQAPGTVYNTFEPPAITVDAAIIT